MQHPTTPRPHTNELPASIWLPAADEPNPAPIPGAVLPAWAIDKIRTDYVGHAEDQPVPLFKIAVRDMTPGVDARIPAVRHTSPVDGQDTLFSPRIILAELHPDALPTPTASAVPAGGHMPGALDDGWPGFFHRTHRILPPDGLLLLATRQRRDAGRLTDPLGTLVATARTAGFRYLQHMIVAYAHPMAGRLLPAPPRDSSRGVTHCDLLALSAIHHT